MSLPLHFRVQLVPKDLTDGQLAKTYSVVNILLSFVMMCQHSHISWWQHQLDCHHHTCNRLLRKEMWDVQCAVLDIVGQTIRFILRQATGNWTNLFALLLFNLVQEYMAQENITQKYMAQKYMAQKCMGQEYMTQDTEYMIMSYDPGVQVHYITRPICPRDSAPQPWSQCKWSKLLQLSVDCFIIPSWRRCAVAATLEYPACHVKASNGPTTCKM